MSPDQPSERDDPQAAHPDDATEQMPVDPGKTWVPEERDWGPPSDTDEAPEAPDETEAGSLEGLSQSEAGGADKNDEPPKQFGDYELLEQVGRGGMGNVYKARHRSLDRIVALKTLRSSGTEQVERQVERFVREAKAAARLDHPNIVPCYEFGEHRGWHYLTMAFVEGVSLHDQFSQGAMEPREAARMVHALTDAVCHAHKQGVIHRDIKPGNVLLGEDGRPRLTDFGIAKLIDLNAAPIAPTQLTQVGQALGTPGFMAPEQSAGRRWEVGPSVDIYGLGGVLSAALTGRPGSTDTVATITQECPADLHAICDRCLAYRPQDRYASAEDLRKALDEYLQGTAEPPEKAPETGAQPVTIKLPELTIKLPSPGVLKAIGFIVAVLVCSFVMTMVVKYWGGGNPADPNAAQPAGPGDPTDNRGPLQGRSAAPRAPKDAPVRCRLEVLVNVGKQPYLHIDDANTLPLQENDELLLDVKVDRAQGAFLYLVGVDTQGHVSLLNDGNPIALSPTTEEIRPDPMSRPRGQEFSAQAEATTYLPIDRAGPAGMLTLVLASRKTPLPSETRALLERSFANIKPTTQPAPTDAALQRFSFRGGRLTAENGLPDEAHRTPFAANHPVTVTIGAIHRTLDPVMDHEDVITFAVPARPE